MELAARAPDCFRCRAFFVTHDPSRPYGCRTYAFRSALLPAAEVRLASGRECAAFEEKERPSPHRYRPG